MTRENVLIELTKIIEEVLDESGLVINENTTASDVEDWDSIMHIEIVVEIEEFYGVKFKTKQIEDFKNVGNIISAIIETKS